jgi:diaminopimelate decarboxylase
VTLYEVGTVKELPGLRTYVSVDGGMSDNIRTALYDARYTAVLASRASQALPPRHAVREALRERRHRRPRRAAALGPGAG